uniref:Uncharacterized protein n=1 Tax=Oryza glaberrima TaxID=4538 RepID=I1Q776_ORYGL
KQKVVALSSYEAEYIAATTIACQGVWLALLLAELRGEEGSAVTLKVDNQSAILLSKNLCFTIAANILTLGIISFGSVSRKVGRRSNTSILRSSLQTF